MRKNPKVIVIGLDGGTLDLMNPWMDRGKLPAFEKIRKQGVYGKLRSTTPYYSAPAWVSIVTGCQPGKHGIYDFFHTDTSSKKLVNSRYRKTQAIWNFLTDNGNKSIIVNVPGTYPPEKINGVMITGLLTPSPEANFTYPKYIKENLVEGKLGKYELEQVAVDDIPKNLTARYAPEKFAGQINNMTASHATVTMNLMKEHEWDFTMVVFRGTDDAQHLLWGQKDLILSCYQTADDYINRMMEQYPDATFIIVSDHGFGKPKKYLYVNNLLYDAGYLEAASNPNCNLNSLIALSFDKLSRIIFHMVPLQKLVRSPIGRKFILSGGGNNTIDFSHTKAFYHSICSRGIRINLKGKYEHGVVDKENYEKLRTEIIMLLRNLKDPETKKNIVKEIYRWEEIYGENAVNDPLDIVFDLEEEYGAQELLQPPEGLRHAFRSKNESMSILSPPGFYEWAGDHRPEGIFFMYGKNVKSNQKINASVVDIVPTILAAMNNPIPKHIDGRVIKEVFIEKPKIKNIDSNKQKNGLLTEEEMKKIKKLKLTL
ncbi:MAG: alkaline phosphatase family protein [Candidatus Thermoplasmatota archaeon]|nr:alkaline phosphatase family protein [Candidatus Thermoplasmatota archaeon]